MAEELELTLDAQEASSMYIILSTAIDAFNFKARELEAIKAMPKENRPPELQEDDILKGVIELNKTIVEDSHKFLKEVGEILLELDTPKPIKITKPFFGNGKP